MAKPKPTSQVLINFFTPHAGIEGSLKIGKKIQKSFFESKSQTPASEVSISASEPSEKCLSAMIYIKVSDSHLEILNSLSESH